MTGLRTHKKNRFSLVIRLSVIYLLFTMINLTVFWVGTGTRQMRLISEKALSESNTDIYRLVHSIKAYLNLPLYRRILTGSLTAEQVTDRLPDPLLKAIQSSEIAESASEIRIISDEGRLFFSSERKADKKVSTEEIQLLFRALQQKEQRNSDFLAEPVGDNHRLNIMIPLYWVSGESMGIYMQTPLPGIRKEVDNIFNFGLLMVLILLLIQTVFGVYLYMTLLKPVRKLSEGAQQVADQKFEVMIKPPGYRDELRDLTLNFNEMARSLKEKTEALEQSIRRLEEKDTVIQMELDMAQGIQQGIIPERMSDHDFFTVAAEYAPLHKVSGDYYDFFKVDKDTRAILIADASGHGVPAALVTVMAKVFFTEASIRYTSPSEVLNNVNENLEIAIQTTDYMTAFYILLNRSGEFQYASASHGEALILRKDSAEPELIEGSGFFIGAMHPAPFPYEEFSEKLEPGDRVVLCTDGITESENKNNKPFGLERFKKSILKHRGHDIETMRDRIIKDVLKFSKGRERFDDYTLMIIEFNG